MFETDKIKQMSILNSIGFVVNKKIDRSPLYTKTNLNILIKKNKEENSFLLYIDYS